MGESTKGAGPPLEEAAMFQVTVSLSSWGLGDAGIVMTMPAGGELTALLDAAYPEPPRPCRGTRRTRLQKEFRQAFAAFKSPQVEISPLIEVG